VLAAENVYKHFTYGKRDPSFTTHILSIISPLLSTKVSSFVFVCLKMNTFVDSTSKTKRLTLMLNQHIEHLLKRGIH
jgi:hypothetical protein